MSESEQQQHLEALWVREKRLKKRIACLHSKARQVSDQMHALTISLRQPWNLDYPTVKKSCTFIEEAKLPEFVTDLESAHEDLSVVQEEIRAIERADRQIGD